jgi:hypothetical protein
MTDRPADLQEVLALCGPGFARDADGSFGRRPSLDPSRVQITDHAVTRAAQRLGVTRATANGFLRRLLVEAATRPTPPVLWLEGQDGPGRHYEIDKTHLVLTPDLLKLLTVWGSGD